ncbi:MAG: hypothetical protein ACREF7_03360 [Candidatus Saccharimonadales bacterium]
MAHKQLILPLRIVSQGDAMRLLRELEALNDYIHQSELRQPGTTLKTLPKASASLTDFASENNLNLLKAEAREEAIGYLSEITKNPLVVHISFASEPSSTFMHKIAGWFREQINPNLLINVGLEPSIAAGFTLRTLNHYHDFSLRQQFSDQRELLLKGIREPVKSKPL